MGRVEHENARVEGGLNDGRVVGVHDAHADDRDLEAGLAQGPDDRLGRRLARAGLAGTRRAEGGRFDRCGDGPDGCQSRQSFLEECSPLDFVRISGHGSSF